MKNEISFSIVTPVYNREDCILRCLKSVTNQKNNNYEHLIVDDGSTDGTTNLIEEYAKTHQQIHFFKFSKNQGVNAARNYAIKNCKNKYVLFLDSDDYMNDNALDTIEENISLHQGYSHYLFAQNHRMDYYRSNSLLSSDFIEINFYNWIKNEISGDFLHVIYREIIQQFPFDEKLRIYEELNFMKMYKFSQKQLFINKAVMHIEISRFDSVSKEATLINSNAIQSQFEFLKQMIDSFEVDYKKYNIIKLNSMINRCLIFSLALSDYNYYKYLSKKYQKNILLGKVMCQLGLGPFLKFLIMSYSRIKHL